MKLNRTDDRAAGMTIQLGVLLISLGAMIVEIALTRVFSLLFFYHFTFLVVGLAMLGLAVGGLLVWWQGQRGGLNSGTAARWATGAGLATATMTAAVAIAAPLQNWALYTVLAAMPFVAVGASTAAVLVMFPASSGKIYGADLAGAAAGTLLSIPLLDLLGGMNGLLGAAALMGLGGWLLRDRALPRVSLLLASALALSILAIVNPITSLLNVDLRAMDSAKSMANDLTSAGRLVLSRWNSFARTDVVAPADRNDLMYVYVDGGAASAMYRFDGELSSIDHLRSDIGFAPFYARPAGEMLTIGPGGGKDVLLGLLGGATRVTAVEVSPATVEAVRSLSQYNGGIYDRPDVEVVTDEGRSYLRRSSRQYDTLYLSLAMVQTAERTGYALTENYLYTVEALRDYLVRLKPGGQLVMKLHDRLDLERVIRTAAVALREEGVAASQIPWYLLAIAEPDTHNYEAGIMYPLLVIRKEPFAAEDAAEQIARAMQSGFAPVYIPGEGGVGALADLGTALDPSPAADMPASIDLSPTTDDRPFFYLYNYGPPTVPLLVAISALLLSAVAWLRLRGSAPRRVNGLRSWIAYFAALGAAFMMVEVTLLQKLTLFLGHPTLAITTILFSLLLAGAAGSWLSGKLGDRPYLPAFAALLAGGMAAGYFVLIPLLTTEFLGAPIHLRVALAVGMIAPLGLVMGIPFPSGLRVLAGLSPAPLASLAWAANGFASVFGSALAVVLATVLGVAASLAVAGVVYGVAALLAAGALGPNRQVIQELTVPSPIEQKIAVSAGAETP